MDDISFSGPLFLIGMPRSGTKLLGTLLNHDARITICTLETDFLPYWVGRWDTWGDLSDRDTFSRFYADAGNLPFFINLRKYDRLVGEAEWYAACGEFTPAGVFEALLRLETGATKHTDRIWGDKSPSYTRHVALLLDQFPRARIVHIIRDARDYCLSINNAWGKNMIRAAQRWADDVAGARAVGLKHPESYAEVLYENLLADPAGVMKRLCRFLDIEFRPDMIELKKPTEQVGEARDAKIKKENVRKYVNRMKPGTRRTIEQVTGGVLADLGYPVDPETPNRRIGRVRMLAYQFSDAMGLFRSSVGERGFWGALWWNARSYLTRW